MFHEELVIEDPNLDLIGSDTQLGLDMAGESIVLTKNEQETLPLDVSTSMNILVTGPTASSLTYQSGGWTGEWQGVPDEEVYFTYGTTVVEGMKSASDGWTIKYTCGVDILGNDCEDPLDDDIGDDDSSEGDGVLDQVNGMYGKFKDWAGLGRAEPSNSMERAAALASSSDVVVVCIGEESCKFQPMILGICCAYYSLSPHYFFFPLLVQILKSREISAPQILPQDNMSWLVI
jgi:beta-glucosidase